MKLKKVVPLLIASLVLSLSLSASIPALAVTPLDYVMLAISDVEEYSDNQ